MIWTLRTRRCKIEIETTPVVIGALGSLRSSLRASSPGRSGKKKESLQLRLWNLNICIEKVDAKCWLAEMTLVMTTLPLARVFQCLFTFALVSGSCWLSKIWQLSRRGTTGELEVEFKIDSREVVASSSSISGPAALVPGELARRLITKGLEKYVDRTPRTTSVSVLQKVLLS